MNLYWCFVSDWGNVTWGNMEISVWTVNSVESVAMAPRVIIVN